MPRDVELFLIKSDQAANEQSPVGKKTLASDAGQFFSCQCVLAVRDVLKCIGNRLRFLTELGRQLTAGGSGEYGPVLEQFSAARFRLAIENCRYAPCEVVESTLSLFQLTAPLFKLPLLVQFGL
ncbi:MAG: hypothetical protein ACTHOU_18655 [Aureliella sp.]